MAEYTEDDRNDDIVDMFMQNAELTAACIYDPYDDI